MRKPREEVQPLLPLPPPPLQREGHRSGSPRGAAASPAEPQRTKRAQPLRGGCGCTEVRGEVQRRESRSHRLIHKSHLPGAFRLSLSPVCTSTVSQQGDNARHRPLLLAAKLMGKLGILGKKKKNRYQVKTIPTRSRPSPQLHLKGSPPPSPATTGTQVGQ